MLKALFNFFFGFAIFVFVALVLFSHPSLVRALPNHRDSSGGYGYTLERLKEVEEYSNIDILFLGSSHTYRGFDTSYFDEQGYSSFNLGSSGQTPLNSYYLLEQHIDKLKPKVIVMDTYWRVAQNGTGIESTADISANSEPNFSIFKMAAASRDIVTLQISITNAMQRTFWRDLDEVTQREYPADEYVHGGYVRTERKLDPDKVKNLKQHTAEVNERQLAYTEKIVKLAQANGSKVVLVRTPVTDEFLESIDNYTETASWISDISTRTGAQFLDFNKSEIRDNLELQSFVNFYDKNHLNNSGVVKFNEELFTYLKPILENE